MEEKHSKIGIASFGISILVGFLVVAMFVIAGALNAGRVEHGHDYPGQTFVGLSIIALLAADVLAVGLGIAALCQSGTRRLFGILGLTFSSVTILGTVGLIIIGIAYASRFASHAG
jgi:hypothetical protein